MQEICRTVQEICQTVQEICRSMQDICSTVQEISHTVHTVVSGRKAIVGIMHPVTIGFHISTEISKTNYPRDLKF